MLLLLAACAAGPDPDPDSGGADSAPVDSGDTGEAPFACPAAGAPPDPSAWVPTGAAPAGGLATLAASGRAPIYLGSSLSGVWRLDALDDPEWTPLPRGSTTHTLGDLVVDPADPHVLYRSAGGTLHRSDDAGETWLGTALGSRDAAAEFPGHVYGIGVPSAAPGVVYGLLDTGVFAASTDAGATWEARGYLPVDGGADPMVDYYRRFRIAPGRTAADSLVLHDGTNVYRSVDDGWSWTAVLADAASPAALARDPADPDEVRVGAWVSHDGGATWADSGLDAELAWWGDALYTVADEVLTLTTADGRSREVALPTTGTTAVVGLGDDLYVVDDASIWHSADGGAAWRRYEASNVEVDFSVVVPDAVCEGVVWAGTRCDSGLYRSTDWGASWAFVPAHGHYVMDVVPDPALPGRVWLVNDDMLMRSDDGGESWRHVWQQFHFHGFALDPEVPGRLLMGSVGSGDWADEAGTVYVSEDDGVTWRATTGLPANAASAHSLAFLEGDVVLLGTYKAGDASHLSGSGIGLWRSTDRGESWVAADLPALDIARVTQGGGAAWAATGAGLWRSTDAGVTWARVAEGNFRWVDVRGDHALALRDDGGVWRSDDGGDTWTLDREPVLPPDPLLLENPLARVAWAPWGDAEVAWATIYGRGVERRSW